MLWETQSAAACAPDVWQIMLRIWVAALAWTVAAGPLQAVWRFFMTTGDTILIRRSSLLVDAYSNLVPTEAQVHEYLTKGGYQSDAATVAIRMHGPGSAPFHVESKLSRKSSMEFLQAYGQRLFEIGQEDTASGGRPAPLHSFLHDGMKTIIIPRYGESVGPLDPAQRDFYCLFGVVSGLIYKTPKHVHLGVNIDPNLFFPMVDLSRINQPDNGKLLMAYAASIGIEMTEENAISQARKMYSHTNPAFKAISECLEYTIRDTRSRPVLRHDRFNLDRLTALRPISQETDHKVLLSWFEVTASCTRLSVDVPAMLRLMDIELVYRILEAAVGSSSALFHQLNEEPVQLYCQQSPSSAVYGLYASNPSLRFVLQTPSGLEPSALVQLLSDTLLRDRVYATRFPCKRDTATYQPTLLEHNGVKEHFFDVCSYGSTGHSASWAKMQHARVPPDLNALTVTGTAVTQVPSRAFEAYGPVVSQLFLQNSGIQEIDLTLFQHLDVLDLAHCGIHSLNAIYGDVSSITVLNLQGNPVAVHGALSGIARYTNLVELKLGPIPARLESDCSLSRMLSQFKTLHFSIEWVDDLVRQERWDIVTCLKPTLERYTFTSEIKPVLGRIASLIASREETHDSFPPIRDLGFVHASVAKAKDNELILETALRARNTQTALFLYGVMLESANMCLSTTLVGKFMCRIKNGCTKVSVAFRLHKGPAMFIRLEPREEIELYPPYTARSNECLQYQSADELTMEGWKEAIGPRTIRSRIVCHSSECGTCDDRRLFVDSNTMLESSVRCVVRTTDLWPASRFQSHGISVQYANQGNAHHIGLVVAWVNDLSQALLRGTTSDLMVTPPDEKMDEWNVVFPSPRSYALTQERLPSRKSREEKERIETLVEQSCLIGTALALVANRNLRFNRFNEFPTIPSLLSFDAVFFHCLLFRQPGAAGFFPDHITKSTLYRRLQRPSLSKDDFFPDSIDPSNLDIEEDYVGLFPGTVEDARDVDGYTRRTLAFLYSRSNVLFKATHYCFHSALSPLIDKKTLFHHFLKIQSWTVLSDAATVDALKIDGELIHEALLSKLKEYIMNTSEQERAAFICFVTGSKFWQPIGSERHIHIEFLPGSSNNLPSAATCSRLLRIYDNDPDVFIDKLKKSIGVPNFDL